MIEPTKTVHISQYKNGVITEVEDTTLSEYHLTLYVNGQRQVVISCTPEHLEEMVLGYLLSEGFVKDLSQVEHINFSGDWSLADVWVKQENKPGLVSDCAYVKSNAVFSVSGVIRQFERFIWASRKHYKTGGIHCAVLCDDQDILLLVNDISRHNTIDKIVGMAYKQQIDLDSKYLIISARVPSDMVQKVINCGIPMLVARSLATYEAIQVARRSNLTLVGRIEDKQMKIYSGKQRLK
ncbi:MAG: formate dehydrogenase accessory sulfurtransferase FdhD [Syntrophomonadaceae bacterium]|nr:formate dehydrogenase accessory sulfurtransferase FdhD [Syntrophomonadaceae bacterium]